MKFAAILLSLLIPATAVAQPTPPVVSPSTAPVGLLEPLLIIAPLLKKERPLKIARATGGVVAASGVGLMVYTIFFAATGPVGWAAGLIFFGGMTAYLAHQGLKDKNASTPDKGSAPSQSAGGGF